MNLKRKKNLLIALLLVGLAVALTACGGGGNGNAKESAAQGADTTALENNQPIPFFNYSEARANLMAIETAEANDVVTTSFFMHNGNQDPISSCPSIGFGIPDSASLSNPWQETAKSGVAGGVAVGQMDPIGYYAPTSSAGTFVICLDSTGQPYIDRIEDYVDTAGGPASWDYTKHDFQLTGAPTAAAVGAGR